MKVFYHASARLFEVGDVVLPPRMSGVSCNFEVSDVNHVYVSVCLLDAYVWESTFAMMGGEVSTFVYRVEPLSDGFEVETDPSSDNEGGLWFRSRNRFRVVGDELSEWFEHDPSCRCVASRRERSLTLTSQ